MSTQRDPAWFDSLGGSPRSSDEPTITPQQQKLLDDGFHASMAETGKRLFREGSALPPEAQWRLSWLCTGCCSIHYVYGALNQVQPTATTMIMLGYPMVVVEDAAYVEIKNMDDNPDGSAEHVARAAQAYVDFCAGTKGT